MFYFRITRSLVLSYNRLTFFTKVKLMTFLQLIYLRSKEGSVVRVVHSDPGCRYGLPIYSFPCSIHTPKSIFFVWVCFLVTESHHVTKAGLELAMFKLSIKLKLASSSVSSCLRLPSGNERALQICRHHNITVLDQCLKKNPTKTNKQKNTSLALETPDLKMPY